MIMIGDQTDLMTNTCAVGIEKSAPAATDVPTHVSRLDVTNQEATVVILDSQNSDEKEQDEGGKEDSRRHETSEYGSSIALSEHTRMQG